MGHGSRSSVPPLPRKPRSSSILRAASASIPKTEAGRDEVAHSQPASASIPKTEAGRDEVPHSQPASAQTAQPVASRMDSGVVPVHSRKARKNELGSSKPMRNAISEYGRAVLTR